MGLFAQSDVLRTNQQQILKYTSIKTEKYNPKTIIIYLPSFFNTVTIYSLHIYQNSTVLIKFPLTSIILIPISNLMW